MRGIIKDQTYIGVGTARRSEVVGRCKKDGKSKIRMLPSEQWVKLADPRIEPLVTNKPWLSANAALVGRHNRPTFERNKHGRLFAGHVDCAKFRIKTTPTTKKLRTGKNYIYLYKLNVFIKHS